MKERIKERKKERTNERTADVKGTNESEKNKRRYLVVHPEYSCYEKEGERKCRDQGNQPVRPDVRTKQEREYMGGSGL